MARSHGRCRRGERLRMGFPHGHRKTTTFVAGLRKTGMVAPMTLDGPISGDCHSKSVNDDLPLESQLFLSRTRMDGLEIPLGGLSATTVVLSA